jgi:hypothetical protein
MGSTKDGSYVRILYGLAVNLVNVVLRGRVVIQSYAKINAMKVNVKSSR